MENEQKQQTLAEEIEQYTPNETHNVADLDFFSITEPIITKEYNEGKENAYKVKILIRDGKEYRVPFVVIGQMKEWLNKKPHIKAFQVIKTGSGKEGTKYQTSPHIIGM